jgi:D-glycero-D-manno-heptose 1,7-bisphosphate phosphatase
MNRAIFIDRDGTIIKECEYLSEPEKVIILSGVIEGLKLLKHHNFKCIVVSNQSGVARGYFKLSNVLSIEEKINEFLIIEGIKIDAYYYCPHHIDGIIKEYAIDCNCRKPKIQMALNAQKEFDINLSESYMIGDKDIDIQFGKNFGAKGTILVKTGYGKKFLKSGKILPDFIATDFIDADNFIL